MRISVSVGLDEQVIANQQRRFHRPRRNAGGLEQWSVNDQREDECRHQRPDGLSQSALPAFFLARHGYWPERLRLATRLPRSWIKRYHSLVSRRAEPSLGEHAGDRRGRFDGRGWEAAVAAWPHPRPWLNEVWWSG